MKTLSVAAMTVLALTACGAPGKGAAYEDVNELAAAYGAAIGAECTETRGDINDYGWNQTNCGGASIIMTFTSYAKREEIKGKNPLEPGELWLQAANWLIQDTQYNIEEAQPVLGGEIVE